MEGVVGDVVPTGAWRDIENSNQFQSSSKGLGEAMSRRRGIYGIICLIFLVLLLIGLIAPVGLILLVIGAICFGTGNFELCENSSGSAVAMIVFGCLFLFFCSGGLGCIGKHR